MSITSNMATKLGQVSRLLQKSAYNARIQLVPKRNVVYTESGGVIEQPEQVKFGLVKVFAVSIPFLWAGATLSKNGAAFLEENDIFVPDDDDD